MKSWQHRRLATNYRNGILPRLYVMKGRHKGQYCRLRYITGSKLSVTLETVKPLIAADAEVEINYVDIEELDAAGNPEILPVIDMTGREISVDSYVAYSVPSGHSSHALEIGKVIEITRVGALRVRAIVHNGEKLKPDRWRNNESIVNDPFRTVKLPVDVSTVTMWIMQDFEEMAKSA